MAGLRPPFHYFEVTQLLDRTLDELGVPALVEGEAAGAYAHDVVGELVRSPESMNEVLAELNQLCIATGYCSTLRPFYLLHFADRSGCAELPVLLGRRESLEHRPDCAR